MFRLIQAIPFSYAALFPVLNPLGSALIFLTITRGLSAATLSRLALRIGINTFILLVVVLLTGSWILRFFGITIPIVEIGGGLVVAYIGWVLLSKPPAQNDDTDNTKIDDKGAYGMAFFPLTMPITAGPGCIAVTLTIGAHEVSRHSLILTFMGQIGAIIGIALAGLTVFLCYRYAHSLTNFFGKTGTEVVMRLAAFVNLCIGLEIVWHGVQGLMQNGGIGAF